MCSAVLFKGKELATVREMQDALHVTLVRDARFPLPPQPDDCLCGIDIPASLAAAGIRFHVDMFSVFYCDHSEPHSPSGS